MKIKDPGNVAVVSTMENSRNVDESDLLCVVICVHKTETLECDTSANIHKIIHRNVYLIHVDYLFSPQDGHYKKSLKIPKG